MGKMLRCPQGHFYDTGKHSECPWCHDASSGEAQKTRPISGGGTTPVPSPTPPRPPADGKTRRLDLTEQGIRPVVGWLVCVDGPEKGNDYRLHSEKNFVGRDPSMDVCIGGDESVSRLKHAILTYEPKKRSFWLQPGESEGLVYLDDEVVNTPQALEAYQTIEIGASKLVMVPFDSGRFPLD